MDPFDSAAIIIKHIEKGVEVSLKNRLGKTITDIIMQHHGTNLVRYFHSKAVEKNIADGVADEIDPSRFRYPGPKPQSLEAALVMLADIAEACCRSLDSPTSQMIKEMTEKVCWHIMEDGQLDESGMTLKDYHSTMEVYINMLTSFYHQRVKYPAAQSAPKIQSLAKTEADSN